jgi:hypothetical protein
MKRMGVLLMCLGGCGAPRLPEGLPPPEYERPRPAAGGASNPGFSSAGARAGAVSMPGAAEAGMGGASAAGAVGAPAAGAVGGGGSSP